MCALPTTWPTRSGLRRRWPTCARSFGRRRRRRWTRGRITRRCCGIWRGWAGERGVGDLRATLNLAATKKRGPGQMPRALPPSMKKLKLRRPALRGSSELVAQASANDIDTELGIEAIIVFRAKSVMQVFAAQEEIWRKFVFHATTGCPTDMGFRDGGRNTVPDVVTRREG